MVNETDDFETISAGNIVGDSLDIPIFNTFEVEIETFELPLSIITTGFTCMMHIGCSKEEITIEKVLEQNKIVKSFSHFKAIIKTKNAICAEKCEILSKLGSFTLMSLTTMIGCGKILRYKKLN